MAVAMAVAVAVAVEVAKEMAEAIEIENLEVIVVAGLFLSVCR